MALKNKESWISLRYNDINSNCFQFKKCVVQFQNIWGSKIFISFVSSWIITISFERGLKINENTVYIVRQYLCTYVRCGSHNKNNLRKLKAYLLSWLFLSCHQENLLTTKWGLSLCTGWRHSFLRWIWQPVQRGHWWQIPESLGTCWCGHLPSASDLLPPLHRLFHCKPKTLTDYYRNSIFSHYILCVIIKSKLIIKWQYAIPACKVNKMNLGTSFKRNIRCKFGLDEGDGKDGVTSWAGVIHVSAGCCAVRVSFPHQLLQEKGIH